MKIKLLLAPVVALSLLVASCCGNNAGAKTDGAEDTVAGSSCCREEAAGCCKNSENMVKIITAYKFIKPEKVDEFIEFTKPIIEKSRAEEGCISYTLYQDPSDNTKFIFYEEWKDQAAIDYHFSTEHFKLAGSRPDFEARSGELAIYDAKRVE
ncbi:MAG: antibiotic biosynthesis monooxygenase [Rikenellaceae bacterium]|nr:antibiotic biosynthesis monooxygenase [Rikenellaceae bacterium]